MTVTYTLSDAAVWTDGSPITYEDFECTRAAFVNTPESLTTLGYDQISSVLNDKLAVGTLHVTPSLLSLACSVCSAFGS